VNWYEMSLNEKLITHFFFSSRRRHTRFSRDWSSDVCSSDLIFIAFLYFQRPQLGKSPRGKRLDRIKQSSNYRDGRFQNPNFTPRSEERRVGKEYRSRESL